MDQTASLQDDEVLRAIHVTKRTRTLGGRVLAFLQRKLLREEADEDEDDEESEVAATTDDDEAPREAVARPLREFRLNDISFSVRKGEFVAITGPSGSGKSTLMLILGGVIAPDAGSVIGRGKVVFLTALAANNLSHHSLEANIRFLWRLHGLDVPLLDRQWSTILDFAEIDSGARKVRHLSKSEIQRVLIAAVLHSDAAILLSDGVPFRFDLPFVEKCEARARQLAEQGQLTMIFSCSSTKHAARLTQRALVLEGGQLIFDGSVAEAAIKMGAVLDDSLEWEDGEVGSLELADLPTLRRAYKLLDDKYAKSLEEIALLQSDKVALNDLGAVAPGELFTGEQTENLKTFLARRKIITMSRVLDVSIARAPLFRKLAAQHSECHKAVRVEGLYVFWQTIGNLPSPLRMIVAEPHDEALCRFYESLATEFDVTIDHASLDELFQAKPQASPSLLTIDLGTHSDEGAFAKGRLAALAHLADVTILHNYSDAHLDDIDAALTALREEGFRIWKPLTRQVLIERTSAVGLAQKPDDPYQARYRSSLKKIASLQSDIALLQSEVARLRSEKVALDDMVAVSSGEALSEEQRANIQQFLARRDMVNLADISGDRIGLFRGLAYRELHDQYENARKKVALLQSEKVALDDMLAVAPGETFTEEQTANIRKFLARRQIATMSRMMDISVDRAPLFRKLAAQHSECYKPIRLEGLYVFWQSVTNLSSPLRMIVAEPHDDALGRFYASLAMELDVIIERASIDELLKETPAAVEGPSLLTVDLGAHGEAGAFANGRLAALARLADVTILHNYSDAHLDDIDEGLTILREEGFRIWKPFTKQVVIERVPTIPFSDTDRSSRRLATAGRH